MFSLNLAINTTTIMYIVIGVVLVLMIVLTIVPQKKRQKQQQQMMSSLSVGTKIMTIGRMVGKITQVNADNTLIVNVGTETNPTLIVIDRNAVGLVLENVAAPAVEPELQEDYSEAAPAEDTFEEFSAMEETENFDDIAVIEEAPVEEEKPAKKGKK